MLKDPISDCLNQPHSEFMEDFLTKRKISYYFYYLKFGQFMLDNSNIELNQPQLEMALHASSCTIVVKEEHEKYLSNLTSAYKAYFNKLRLSNEQKEELKHKIDKGAKIAISATSQVIEKAKVDKISAVEEVLKTFVIDFHFILDSFIQKRIGFNAL